jgi:alkanesulfonate monooxygenase SsuD/methylene tetrahydromethanopterin reductase-like flavin-dependent oxidoreductase (luciferase family)
VQKKPRIWIGGMGEKRLLRMVAKYADGWNVPFVGSDVYAGKNQVLTQWCEKLGREPTEIRRTVNLGLAIGAGESEAARKREGLRQQFGAALPFLEAGMLIGTPAEVRDRVAEYVRGGAEWVIVALRAPFDLDGLQVFVEEVMPAFQS